MHCALENGADLCVNEGPWLSKYRVSPTEEERKKERKKEKSRFLTVSGSVCRRPLWKMPLCVLVVFPT